MKYLIIICTGLLLLTACSKDEVAVPDVQTAGQFTDPRDGTVYHYMTVAGLDWSIENLRYDLGDLDKCRIYQSVNDAAANRYTTTSLEKYGMLYTHGAAREAVPEGWRLPTDAEWQQLEASHAYQTAPFALRYGGYYTKNTYASAANGYRFMAAWAYFWAEDRDAEKEGEFYVAHKKFYDRQDFERLSMEPDAYFLSVRFVRNN